MWYAIMANDSPSALKRRMAVQGVHVARLRELAAQNRLLMAGPYPAAEAEGGTGRAGFIGSLIVAQFDSLKDAQDWSDADPYWRAGIYWSVDVRPFCPVLR